MYTLRASVAIKKKTTSKEVADTFRNRLPFRAKSAEILGKWFPQSNKEP